MTAHHQRPTTHSGRLSAVRSLKPGIQLPTAVGEALKFSGLKAVAPGILSAQEDTLQRTRVANAGISLDPIDGSLMLLPVRPGEARLVWNFQIHTLDKQHSWDLTVDAATGQVWTRFDWTASDQYRVYAQRRRAEPRTPRRRPTAARCY